MRKNILHHSLSSSGVISLRRSVCRQPHPRMENIATLRNESHQTKPIFLGSKKTPREIFLTNFARRLSQPLVICNHIISSVRVDN